MFPEGRAFEFLIVAIVALVVVGPKDLPVLLRRLGQFMAKLRGMAAEFRASFDEMARQSELDELRKEVEALRRGQMAEMGQMGQAELNQTVGEIERNLADVGVQLHPPMSHQYAEAPSEPAPPTTIAMAEASAPKKARAAAAAQKPAKKAAKTPAGKPAGKASAKPRAKKTGGAAP